MINFNKMKFLILLVMSICVSGMAADAGEVMKLPDNIADEVAKRKEEAGDAVDAEDTAKVIGEAICRVEVSKYNTISVHAQNVRISTVLQTLAIKAHRNIVLAAGADRIVSMTFYSVPFEQALQTMLDVNGLAYNVKDSFISVFTKKELTERVQGAEGLTSAVFRLNYLRPKDALLAIKGLLSKDGSAEAMQDDEPDGKAADMSMEGTKKDDPVYKPEKRQYSSVCSLIVHDYKENVESVTELLKKLDKRPPQILLEATILEVVLNESNALGVDFAILQKSSFLEFFNFDKQYNPFSNAVRDAANKIVYDDKGVPVSYDTSKKEGGSAFFSTAVGGVGTKPGTVKGGFSYGDFSVFIRALSQYNNVSVLSNPKVLSLDRQRARVMMGQNVGYIESNFQDGQIIQTTKFIETGIVLDVRPYILKNNLVRLVMAPKISKVSFREQEVQAGVTQQIPDETIKTVAADIVIPQGATAVIGGLFQEEIQKNARQIPLVGDFPIVGGLGRGQDDVSIRKELIFMIKATILNDNELADNGNSAKNDVVQMLSGSRRGLLPWSKNRQSANLSLKSTRAFYTGQHDLAEWMARRALQLSSRQPDVIRQLVDTLESDTVYTSEDGAMYDFLRKKLKLKKRVRPDIKTNERAKAAVLQRSETITVVPASPAAGSKALLKVTGSDAVDTNEKIKKVRIEPSIIKP
ncbi:MAG: type II secretion system protein GspD [Planctomycetota bacterium]|jgi:type II secretory pathway component GspD/PulD (secretin)